MASPLRPLGPIAVVWVAGTFLATLWAPEISALRCLYVFPILMAVRAPSDGRAWAAAAVTTLLIGIARILSPSPATPLALDTLVPAGMLWLAAALVVGYRHQSAAREAAVSAEHEAHVALSQSQRSLEDFKYALDESAIVAITDPAGTITYVNDTFCRISQYSRDELVGRTHRVVNSGVHPAGFFQELWRTITAGQVWRGEICNRAKDGSLYWVSTTIVPFLDSEGRPYQYVAVRHDVTERKRSEAALRDEKALAQLGQLAAVVAHEVRNPLAGIRGALQIIAPRLAESSAERAIVGEAVTRIDTLNEIVNDLLLFARPTKPVLAPVSVARLISDTVTLVRQDPTVADVVIDTTGTDATVFADEHQIKQILLNLLMNGAQAMGGQGRLTVSTQESGLTVEIRVADEGPGIAEDVRARLFEPFFTTRHRGTGLGLATARRLVDAHGGSIRLECPDSGGTVAIVELPASPPRATGTA